VSERDPVAISEVGGAGSAPAPPHRMLEPAPRRHSGSGVVIDGRAGASDGLETMVREVRSGLAGWPPSIPSKYLYDDRGSRLFEEITCLPEYYQCRTEERLLEEVAAKLVDVARPTDLVELGSGAGRKIRLLLEAMGRRRLLRSCTLLDINESFLTASARRLASAYSGLRVRGVVGDFTRDLSLLGRADDRLVVFLAGTFGNLEPGSTSAFLKAVRAALGRNAWFLVGLDLVKEVAVLERAYNDAGGVTAAFNLNVLEVLNARLGADFDVDAFEHVAFYDRDREWIEMRVRARKRVRVRLPAADLTLELDEGGEIRTEISCKYTQESFARVLEGTGLALRRWFVDAGKRFALALVEVDSRATPR
jgi:L-histidine N-alpha-methyltransferase